MTLAEYVKRERTARGWSQEELAEKTGGALTRGYIANLEASAMVEPRAGVLAALSRAFRVPVSTIYEEIGLLPSGKPLPREGFRELLDRARLSLPLAIPVYQLGSFGEEGRMPHEPEMPLSPELVPPGHRVEGYRVDNNLVLVVDYDGDMETGDDVICVCPSGVQVCHIRRIDGALWVEGPKARYRIEDCGVIAPVILEIRIKKRSTE